MRCNGKYPKAIREYNIDIYFYNISSYLLVNNGFYGSVMNMYEGKTQ